LVGIGEVVLLPTFQHTVDFPGIDSRCRLWFLGDIHAGSNAVNAKRLEADVAEIAANGDYWIGMGDYGDWIFYSDKRFDNYEMADWMDIGDPWTSTSEWICDHLAPIAGHCWGMIDGNHEVTVAQRYHMPVQQWLCGRLGVLNLGPAAYIRLKFKRTATSRENIDVFAIHGWGGGRTSGARTNKLESVMACNEAHIYAMAHVHGQRPVLTIGRRSLDARGRATNREKVGVISGTYLGEAEYATRTGYAPSVIGGVPVDIWPYQHRLCVSSRANW
jgi:hypothetical protein